jgi:hypothetical protein
MLDLLLKALDRLNDLAKIRSKRKRARFDEIYRPSFDELQAVHKDYLDIFTTLLSKLPTNMENSAHSQDSVRDARDYLVRRRTELEPARRKIRALWDVMSDETIPPSERDFLQSISHYLFSGGLTPSNPGKSCTLAVLDFLESALTLPTSTSGPDVPQLVDTSIPIDMGLEAAKLCENALNELRTAWAECARAYARLQIQSSSAAV